MSDHLFKFTVEHLKDSKGTPAESDPLVFEANVHENLFKIVELMQSKTDLDKTDSATFALGLKLFGQVLMKNKDDELFQQFIPSFVTFMKDLRNQ